MNLTALPRGLHAVIDHVEACGLGDPIMIRLLELGFVPGEDVEVVALGPLGGDPLAVRVGGARFALRRNEAARVHLRVEQPVRDALEIGQPGTPHPAVTRAATAQAPHAA